VGGFWAKAVAVVDFGGVVCEANAGASVWVCWCHLVAGCIKCIIGLVVSCFAVTQVDHHLVATSLDFVIVILTRFKFKLDFCMVLIWPDVQHFIGAYFLTASNSRCHILKFPHKSSFLSLLVTNAQIIVIWTLNSKFNICMQLIYQLFLQSLLVWNHRFMLERSEVSLQHHFVKRFHKDAQNARLDGFFNSQNSFLMLNHKLMQMNAILNGWVILAKHEQLMDKVMDSLVHLGYFPDSFLCVDAIGDDRAFFFLLCFSLFLFL